MMRADVKRLSEREHVFVDRSTGEIINVDRAWQKSDKRIALRRREQALLAAAGMDGPEAHWYVLQVKKGLDIAVDKSLEDAKIERWMAQETVVVRRRGRYGMMRPKTKTVPFLPGYIFVNVVWCPPCWHALSGIKGVEGVLGGAERPAPVPEAKMLKLRADVEHDPEAIKAMIRSFDVGDQVSVDDGPFASFPGVVKSVDDRGRAQIEVMLFGQFVSVDLDLAQISKS
ncbi:transcription termination/antitermination protein NusG [Mesorhizobium sp. B2-8-5]|uniref:transcription termination/antitermination protein NusG n=1 Tax=Mesorhizobium sp. B2-8-5 TaxID=2589903 RepID=UPI001D01885E|nr:transcription termination/antitermination protein NusG [Mesorhizobium sp. B2-8-5]UCI23695.1 transcriptional antiterminator NusG [Mesorhizobium sp. B2-8-5]